jgi:hypothetical protein
MMTKQTQTRTLVSLLVLLATLAANTFLELANVYTEFWAWTFAAIAAVACALSLRMQRSATGTQLSAIYAVPVLVMVLGAVLIGALR